MNRSELRENANKAMKQLLNDNKTNYESNLLKLQEYITELENDSKIFTNIILDLGKRAENV